MDDRKQGVIPSQELRAMIARGEIAANLTGPDLIRTGPIQPDQIQPASLDLRLGHRAWRVRASFLSGKDRSVANRLPA
jgi:dCTP deaminase